MGFIPGGFGRPVLALKQKQMTAHQQAIEAATATDADTLRVCAAQLLRRIKPWEDHAPEERSDEMQRLLDIIRIMAGEWRVMADDEEESF